MILANHGLVSYNIQATGFLHDTIEDCKDISSNHIKRIAGPVVAANVEVLTKHPRQSQESYYSRIQQYHIASQVKIADRIHNLHSMEGAWDHTRMKKYIANTLKYYQWAFNNPLLGKELQAAIDQYDLLEE